jgi:hypothetical protein
MSNHFHCLCNAPRNFRKKWFGHAPLSELIRRAIVSIIAAMILTLSSFCFAQGSTSVLGGKVFDPTGKVVKGAKVTVISDDKGTIWTTNTNETGNWRVDALVAGHYHFEVSSEGFAISHFPSFMLEMAGQKFLDVTLSVGTTTEKITVDATEPLIDTTAAVSGTVLERTDIQELPQLNNSPIEFVIMTPGVTYGAKGNTSTYIWSNISLSEVGVNGSGSNNYSSTTYSPSNGHSVNYTLDGGTNTMASNGEIAFIPPMDAIQETRVTTNAYDASIARSSAATINMMMRSGGKDFHGNLYEMDKNDLFDANYYQYKHSNQKRPKVRHNEYGFTVGGPVWIPKLYDGKKNGTFFFFSYDHIDDISPYTSTGNLSLPTEAERTGDFSSSFTTHTSGGVTTTYPVTIYDPANYTKSTSSSGTAVANRVQFTDNVIPSARIASWATALMNLMPLPNQASDGSSTDANNFVTNVSQYLKFKSIAVRVDQAWNNNHHSYITFRHNYFWPVSVGSSLGVNSKLAGSVGTRTNNGVTINHAWVITPRLFLNINGNLTIYRVTNNAQGTGLDPTEYGFSSAFAQSQNLVGLPDMYGPTATDNTGLFDGQAIGSGGMSYENDYNYEVKATLQQMLGNHTIHYGLEWLTQQEGYGDKWGGTGTYHFNDIWTKQTNVDAAGYGEGDTFADFLLGRPNWANIANDATEWYSQPYAGFYVQDDWRYNSKLTINLGVRYDFQFPLTERHNHMFSHYDPDYVLPEITNYAQANYATLVGGETGGNLGIELLQSQKSDSSTFVAKGAIRYAGYEGITRNVENTQTRYVQPRIGFAYQFNPNRVIRGGIGRFVQGSFDVGHASTTGFSSSTSMNISEDNYITQSATINDPFPSGQNAAQGNSLGIYSYPGSVSAFYDPNSKRPYTDDISIHFQQEWKNFLFEVGFVTDRSRQLAVGYDINAPSKADWYAAYGPTFDSNGRPVDTLPGDTVVTNPFKGDTYIKSTLDTSSTVSAWQLLRPSPVVSNGSLTEYRYNGKSDYYALQAKAEKRYRDGFGLTYAFTYGKQMDENSYLTNASYSEKMHRQISSTDIRFMHVITGTYILPIGRGKKFLNGTNSLVNTLISGWEITGQYDFNSGTPIWLPTNSSFFKGGDPGLGSKKNSKKWFDTSKFVAFPSKSVTTSQLADTTQYPSWTNISSYAGYSWVPTESDTTKNGIYHDFSTWHTDNATYYGDVRNPYMNLFDAGLRKNVEFPHSMRLQLSLDAFNVLNHPRFGNVGTTAGSTYFGYLQGSNQLSQINVPRMLQLSGKFFF